MTFASLLGNLGAFGNGMVNSYQGQQDREQKRMQQQLEQQARLQQLAQQQQQFQMQQQQMQLQQQSAAMLAGLLGGQGGGQAQLPQNVNIPGATPMPPSMMPGPQGGPSSFMPPPAQNPAPAPRPQAQGAAAPNPGGNPMPMPGRTAGPATGGGLSVEQLVQRIRDQYGDVDPMTMLGVIQQYQTLMKPEDQQRFKEIEMGLKQQGLDLRARDVETRSQMADLRGQLADWKMAGGGGGDTRRREMEMKALDLGIDPDGMSDRDLSKAVAAGRKQANTDKATPKPTAGERRAATAAKDVNSTIDEITGIIQSNPNAIGIYGRGSGILGKVAGLGGKDAPEDAKAAARLKPLFTKLSQRLGVMDAAGGQGGAGFAKEWNRVIGSGDAFQTPELLLDELNSIRNSVTSEGGAAPRQDPNQGWSITPVQ